MEASSAKKILVVEDEHDIRELIALHLRRVGYVVEGVYSVEEARQKFSQTKYDLVVLDWMLPGEQGVDWVRSLRMSDVVPVLMLTAKSEPEDIVRGLESGADDYLTKPFNPDVLLARVKALLRRGGATGSAEATATIAVRDIRVGCLILREEQVEVTCDGEFLDLTPSEFKLLKALMMNYGKVLTRDRLVGEIQGDGVNVIGRTVDTHVFGLRKKLGETCDYIETIRGIGYRLTEKTK